MDISSLYSDMYSTQIKNAQSSQYKNTVAGKDYSNASDEELMEVCKDFESYFVEQVLKQAVNTFTTGDEASSGSMSTLQGYYKDSLVKEYAEKITDNQEFGLAKTLYEQMKRNYSTDSVQPSEVLNNDNSQNTEADSTSAVEAASTALLQDE